jgi:flagellar basal body-associated protein FliL
MQAAFISYAVFLAIILLFVLTVVTIIAVKAVIDWVGRSSKKKPDANSTASPHS